MEIKVYQAIELYISRIEKVGEQLNEGYNNLDLDFLKGLETCANYKKYLKKFKELFEEYKNLSIKDSEDIKVLLDKFNEMDKYKKIQFESDFEGYSQMKY